jgi:hypothetical protein
VNVAISNVPGPQFPLYFAGAKLAEWYPVSIAMHGVALNMTVQSYNGAVEFGLTACRRAVPDVADLGDYVVEEHRKLMALVAKLEPAAQTPTPPAAITEAVAKISAVAPKAKRAPAPKPMKTGIAIRAKPARAAKPLTH